MTNPEYTLFLIVALPIYSPCSDSHTFLKQERSMKYLLSFVICLSISLSACSKKKIPPVEIAINPWPGYEFLYLAEQKGFFETVGLNVKLLQLNSLADAQRSYVNGYADGMSSTIIEAVQAQILGGKALEIVLVPDFSNGGDVIIARKGFSSLSDLKGKTIGAEVSSLGIYLLQRALTKEGLSLNDINVVNTEQMQGESAILNGSIDAFVSYPPVSIDILKHDNFHKIFSSAEIPNKIIDAISISKEALDQNPGFVPKLHQAWQMALDYYQSQPVDALQIMSRREGISPEEFKDVLSDLQIVDQRAQKTIFENTAGLQNSVVEVCKTLVHVDAISADCNQLPNLVYQGDI